MKITSASAAAILALTSCTAASPINARQTTFKDFQVTEVSVTTAGERPNSSNIWNKINVTVTDPNEYELRPGVITPASTVNCNSQFRSTLGVEPLGRAWECEATGTAGSTWYMELLPGTQGEFDMNNNFNVKLTHTFIVWQNDVGFTKKMAAEGNFNRPGNMQGVCSQAGWGCAWRLKDEVKPVLLGAKDVTFEMIPVSG